MDRAAKLLAAYLRVTQHLAQQMRIDLGHISLTFPQALLLSTLEEHGPLPIGTLAQMTNNANSTVSGIVSRLEELELVARRRAQHDHRIIYVETTETYHQLRAHTSSNVTERLERLLAPMSEADQDKLIQALDRLDELLKAEETT